MPKIAELQFRTRAHYGRSTLAWLGQVPFSSLGFSLESTHFSSKPTEQTLQKHQRRAPSQAPFAGDHGFEIDRSRLLLPDNADKNGISRTGTRHALIGKRKRLGRDGRQSNSRPSAIHSAPGNRGNKRGGWITGPPEDVAAPVEHHDGKEKPTPLERPPSHPPSHPGRYYS